MHEHDDSLSSQASCKVGSRGIERQVILFEKLLLFLKKKEAKRYTYKGHILVSPRELSPHCVVFNHECV